MNLSAKILQGSPVKTNSLFAIAIYDDDTSVAVLNFTSENSVWKKQEFKIIPKLESIITKKGRVSVDNSSEKTIEEIIAEVIYFLYGIKNGNTYQEKLIEELKLLEDGISEYIFQDDISNPISNIK